MAEHVEIEVAGTMTPGQPVPRNDPFTEALRMFQMPAAAPGLQEWVKIRREDIRPWSTFFNSNNFRKPPSLPRLTKRVLGNVEYFKTNYLFVYVGLVLYCLISSPLLLIAICASVGIGYLLYLREKEGLKFNICGRDVPLGQQYCLVALFSLPVFLLAGAGEALFWIFGASVFLIGLHAVFYNIDALHVSHEERFGLEEV